jgi:hypothetical protein
VTPPPIRPLEPTPSMIKPAAQSIIVLTNDELSKYTTMSRDYDRSIGTYRLYQRFMERIKHSIRESVSSDTKRIMTGKSVRDTIILLKRMYSPSDSSRKRLISK